MTSEHGIVAGGSREPGPNDYLPPLGCSFQGKFGGEVYFDTWFAAKKLSAPLENNAGYKKLLARRFLVHLHSTQHRNLSGRDMHPD